MAILNRGRRWAAILQLVALCAGGAGIAAAHGLSVSVLKAPPALVVRATYGGSEPVAFASVEIRGPGAASQPVQRAKTDQRGFFSFVPDRAGEWKIVVDDELGHRTESAAVVPENFEHSAPASTAGPARTERAITGVALLLGLTGVLYGWRARRSSEQAR